MSSRRKSLLPAVALVVAMIGAACGGDDGGSSGGASGGAVDGSWEEVVDAASEEGSVTLYSSQSLDDLNQLKAAFEDEYPDITVEVVRGIDAELSSRVETEQQTGQGGADIYVSAEKGWVQTHGEDGWFAEPIGPQFTEAGSGYDAEQYVHEGNQWEVAAAVLTMAWNTDDADALESYEDLLDPALAGGKIGVTEPTSSAFVDFYLWLEETFGEDYVDDLAAQDPRIYPSTLPLGEALVAGEIFATPYGAPVQLQPAKEAGAPVEYAIDENGAWGARFFGTILAEGAHPNAAQVLADFMVSEEGQNVLVNNASAVRDDVEGALLTNDQVRVMDLAQLTPEKVADYQERWNSLFR